MRHTYYIDVNRNCVYKTNHGPLTVAEEIEIVSRIAADPLFRRGMNAICDFTDGSADWSLNEIDEFRAFVTKIKSIVGPCRWAVVIPRSKSRVSARIFIALHQAFEDTIEVQMFETKDEASIWLEMPVTAD